MTYTAIDISASGLTAEQLRISVVASNLANQDSVSSLGGTPFQRQMVLLSQRAGGGVQVTGVVRDTTPGPLVYDPANPAANSQGYVMQSNVRPEQEMVDLLEASRAYQANVTALDDSKANAQAVLAILG